MGVIRKGSTMSNETDVLLKFWEEQWEQARQCENQRSTMANLILPIFTAGIGLIVAFDFTLKTLPIAIFLILVGLFGAVFSMKLFERWRLHESRAIKWSEKIDKLNPKANILELFWEAHEEHKKKHPRLSKIALYNLWIWFYLLLVALAVILVFFICF